MAAEGLNVFRYPTVQAEIRFQHPCSILFTGSSQVGKSSTAYALLRRGIRAFTISFRKIYIVYGVYQSEFDQLKLDLPNLTLIPLENLNIRDLLKDVQDCFVLFDDSFLDLTQSSEFTELITRGVHHYHFSLGLISQYIFGSGRFSRIISVNSTYLLLFDSCRDRLSVSILARQMFPGEQKYFLDSFAEATKKQYSPLLVDCHPSTPAAIRLRSNILGDYHVA